jgi:hypothetical protein
MGLSLLAAAGCGDSASHAPAKAAPASSTTLQETTPVAPPCDQDPHAGVHDPTRLKIFNPCATFVGKVVEAPELNPSDGDVTFWASPDSGYASLLNDKNRRKGGLHIEIVPRDQPGCTRGEPIKGHVNNLGVCSGAHVLFPPRGSHIRVIGPHVYDSWVGWNEIHPAWQIEILPPTGPVPPEALKLEALLKGIPVGRSRWRGSGRVSLTVTGVKACWRFTRLAGIGRPAHATVRVGRRRVAPVLFALGTHYRARGCVTINDNKAKLLEDQPRRFYVIVATAHDRHGAIRGRLTPSSD